MQRRTFSKVVLKREGTAGKDTGSLVIRGDSIQFDGRSGVVNLSNIEFVSIEKPSRLAVGEWVKVAYRENLKPAAAYFRSSGISGGVNEIFSAMGGFPNSGQFECVVWAYRQRLRPAPFKPGGFVTLYKGSAAATSENALKFRFKALRNRQYPLEDIETFTVEGLSIGQQLRTRLFELLIAGGVIALVLVLVAFSMQRGDGGLAALDMITNLAAYFGIGMGLVLGIGLLWSLPTLLHLRQLGVFRLYFVSSDSSLDFGVVEAEAGRVVKLLESHGIKRSGFL